MKQGNLARALRYTLDRDYCATGQKPRQDESRTEGTHGKTRQWNGDIGISKKHPDEITTITTYIVRTRETRGAREHYETIEQWHSGMLWQLYE